MENRLSPQQEQYICILQTLENLVDTIVNQKALLTLLMITQQHCPWFPTQGNCGLNNWEQVGKTFKAGHSEGVTFPLRSSSLGPLLTLPLSP